MGTENYTYFIYRDDKLDKMVFINGHIETLALQNHTAFGPSSVLNKPGWQFIADSATRHLDRRLIDKVRQTANTCVVPFRRDAPARRRFMSMTISLFPNSAVPFNSVPDKEEPRPTVARLDPHVPRDDSFLTICSCCKKCAGNGINGKRSSRQSSV